MHEGVQRTRKSIYYYVKLIQDIVLRVSNQDARVAGGESNIFNVDVGLHQRSALSPHLFLIHRLLGEELTRIHDDYGRHCRATLWRQKR